MRAPIRIVTLVLALLTMQAPSASSYDPPPASSALLRGIDFTSATPLDEDYRREFQGCDGVLGAARKDRFRGFRLSGDYRCSTDPSRVKTLLKLKDGAIYWESKLALDLDGSWASWSGTVWRGANGRPLKTTDLCGTSLKWQSHGGNDCDHPEAQVDSDQYPFIVIPTAGLRRITGRQSAKIGREFRDKTGLDMKDMGVVIYRDKWSPVFIADGGPFMRLGEGSARLFETLDESRCKKWNSDGTRCVGPGDSEYPYRNFGLSSKVIFIIYPGSRSATLSPETAIAEICAFAERKLGLTGSTVCNR